MIERCTKNRNLFVQEGGYSEYYSPHMMLSRRHIDFEKHVKYSFGSYGIAYHKNKPQKNDPRPRGLDVIYLRPLLELQGGHEVLHLATGRVINGPKFTPVVMTEMVIKRVEQMAKEQGLKSCKFYDRKRNLLLPDDLLEEVGGYLTMYLKLETKICQSMMKTILTRLTYLNQIRRWKKTSLVYCRMMRKLSTIKKWPIFWMMPKIMVVKNGAYRRWRSVLCRRA